MVAVFNTVHQTGGSNAMTIADYIAVGALMIVLILPNDLAASIF
jgi:hypothetical protein